MPSVTFLRLGAEYSPVPEVPRDSEPMVVTVEMAKREYGDAVAYLLSLGDVKLTEDKDGPIARQYELIKKPR